MSDSLTPVFLAAEIRALEHLALSGPSPASLMERAGLAAAEFARDQLEDKRKRVLLFAGPGNNGGDAFVVARHLKTWQHDVCVVFGGAAEKLPIDAATALAKWQHAGGTMLDAPPSSREWDLIVDGLFGIGLQRPIEGRYLEWVNWINRCQSTVLSLDIPSGLHANSGRILGAVVRADHTLTFIGLKAGLLTLDGPDNAGAVQVRSLGVQPPENMHPSGWKIETALLTTAIPARRRNSHKGSYGSVGIVGGANGLVGAALLAGRAALKLGTGRVFVGLLADGPAVDLLQPELMLGPAQIVITKTGLQCIACGPGLGASPAAQAALHELLDLPVPLVLDADALNLLAADPELQQTVATRKSATILTPHPQEAARLLGQTTEWIQRDRIGAARELARRYRAMVVLKGNGSVCAVPAGDWFLNTSGNPGMASAGMGDVLTGMVAALIAQGLAPDKALLCGVHLHALAADRLLAQGIGPAGMTASEVIDAGRDVLNAMTTRSVRKILN
ncbi:MAG: NAD(P)H-hydrate dehydratase [Burkholderiales bacterium]